VVEEGVTEHGVLLDHVVRGDVSGRVVWSRPATGEPRVETHVLQAIPQRGMEDAVESMTEVGVTHLHPVVTRRTVSLPHVDAAKRRTERWRSVAREAAQLAGRAATPAVHPITTLTDAVVSLRGVALLTAVVRAGAQPIRRHEVDGTRPLAIVIGPEGGLDDGELVLLRDAGAREVHLGPRVIPARFAGAIALCIVMAGIGELDRPAEPVPTP